MGHCADWAALRTWLTITIVSDVALNYKCREIILLNYLEFTGLDYFTGPVF